MQVSSAGDPLGIVHFGIGQIGASIAAATATAEGLSSAAAVDLNPALVGRTLSEVCGGSPEVVVRSRLAEALEGGAKEADVAFHAAGSYLRDVEEQLGMLIDAGLGVVTTCEELICPRGGSVEALDRLDRLARRRGVALFAAGVNPGFLMDRLPVYVSSMCLSPRAIVVRRVVDLAERRDALRRKMGVGEDATAVERHIEARSIGHAGLVESLAYVARGLGWSVGEVHERLAPVVAKQRTERAGETVEAGQVLGLEHTAEAVDPSGRSIRLSLVMRIDAEEARDEIEIEADPPLRFAVRGGLNGDRATVASVLAAAKLVAGADPGVIRELSVPAANVY